MSSLEISSSVQHDIVWLSLGTNKGELLYVLKVTYRSLQRISQGTLKMSSLYKSEPWGYKDQPPFINQVIGLQTSLSPLALLQYLQSIEHRLHRKREIHWGPRTIDLDILDWPGERWIGSKLTLPHPLIHKRRFVLLPWVEVSPNHQIQLYPTSLEKLSVETWLSRCKDHSLVEFFSVAPF